jgi:hypothetical protein
MSITEANNNTLFTFSPTFPVACPGKLFRIPMQEDQYGVIEKSIRLIGIDAAESRTDKKARQDAPRSGEDLRTITTRRKEATR